MITENGSIKVITELNVQMQKELNCKLTIAGIILTVLGAIGAAAGLGWSIALFFADSDNTLAMAVLILSAMCLVCGIIYLISVKKAQKTVMGAKKVDTCEFFSDFFEVKEFLNGEQVANVKIYNNQITKAKETKNYMFFYIHASAAYPVSKEGLTDAELERLRAIFRLKPGVKN